jgi:hypothetical protein
MYRWVAGDKKQKPPSAESAARGRAKAAAAVERHQLPALNFDPTTWLHEFAAAHPDGSVVIRDRVSHGIIYECAASVVLASGASLLQHMKADLGDGHYFVQGRHVGKDGKPVLGDHNALTVGTPPPLALVAAINTASKSQDAMGQIDAVLGIVAKAEPIIDKLLGRGGDKATDAIMAAAIENLLNPPNQIAQLVESKRLLAELTAPVGGAPAAPVAAAGGGQIVQGITILSALQDLARSMRGGSGDRRPTMAAQTEKAPEQTPEQRGAPEDQSAAAMAAKAAGDPMGQMILKKIEGACAGNNPELIAHAALSAYDAAVVMDWDGPLMRQFKADPGAVFDEFHRHLATRVATPPEIFAAAREIVVSAVESYKEAEAAEGPPVDIAEGEPADGEQAAAAGDDEQAAAAGDDERDGAPDAPEHHDEAGAPTALTVVVSSDPGKVAAG